MPVTKLSIKRTLTVTHEQAVEVEVDVPQSVLDDPYGDFGLHDWVGGQLDIVGSELTQATVGNWDNTDVDDEDSEDSEISEVDIHG